MIKMLFSNTDMVTNKKKAEIKARLDSSKPAIFSIEEAKPKKIDFTLEASDNFCDE